MNTENNMNSNEALANEIIKMDHELRKVSRLKNIILTIAIVVIAATGFEALSVKSENTDLREMNTLVVQQNNMLKEEIRLINERDVLIEETEESILESIKNFF